MRGPLLYLSLVAAVEVQVRVRCEHCRTYQTWYPPAAQSQIGEVKTIGGG